MGGGSRNRLQPRAGAFYHVGVPAEYWRELIKEEMNLVELSAGYSLCLLHLRDAAIELAKHRCEGLRLGVKHSSLCSIKRMLLVEHGMLTPTVDPVPVNIEEVQRDEERILFAVKDLRIATHQLETMTAECLNAHRLAVLKLCVCVHNLDAYQKRQAAGEMLLQAKVLFRQIDAKYREFSLGLRQTLHQIVERRVENNKIREMNTSLSSCIHNLQCRASTAVPTQEGGVESQMRPQSSTTKICNRWKRGRACIYGDRCRFVHGMLELQHRIPLHPLHKTKPCFYFLSASGCDKGDSCAYLQCSPPPE